MDCIIRNRGILVNVCISDLHFGSMDPATEYQILQEQFLQPISQLQKIDIVSIIGDVFDRKFMANSEAVFYAIKFIDDIVNLSRVKGYSIILIQGTASHDAGQLKLFYHYLDDRSIDFRIVESIKFEYVKGAKILCIPELYSVPEDNYKHFFFESGWYDECLVHGTFKGSVYGDNVGAGRLLVPEDFIYCKGLVIAGHVHKPGCFSSFFYYCGSPMRYKFGEEEAKGYLIVAHDLDTNIHNVEFEEITSFRYDTIYLDTLVSSDPKQIIDYINDLKTSKGIDYIKVRIRDKVPGYNQTIINNYYRNNTSTFVEFVSEAEIAEQKNLEDTIGNSKYDYLIDNSISDYERFVRFVNESEGHEFITVDRLTQILNDINSSSI